MSISHLYNTYYIILYNKNIMDLQPVLGSATVLGSISFFVPQPSWDPESTSSQALVRPMISCCGCGNKSSRNKNNKTINN